MKTIFPPGPNQHHPPVTSPQKPKFGCRLFAYISPQPYEGQDKFLRQALLEGGNSLLRQSQLPYSYEPDNPAEVADPQFNRTQYLKNPPPFQIGWGFAQYLQSMDYCAKNSAASLDSEFAENARAIAEQKPCNLLAHLRQTTNAKNGFNLNNPHPFKINDWALVHVGAVPVDVLATMRNRLNNAHAENSAVQLPKGETDSEVVACYLALQLRDQTGDDASMTIPPSTLEQIFKEVVVEILLNPQKLSDAQVEETLDNGFQGASRNCTNVFALSNGKQLLISKVIPTYDAVYLGTHHQVNGELSFLISHHPMRLQIPANERIDWEALPNDAITSFVRVPKLSSFLDLPTEGAQNSILKKVIRLPVRHNRHREIREDARQISAIINRLENKAEARN